MEGKKMNTILSIVLLIALSIAVVADIIRIYQYIQMRKQTEPETRAVAKADIKKRLLYLDDAWTKDEDADLDVYGYMAEHWFDNIEK